jgi:hypothetical protein
VRLRQGSGASKALPALYRPSRRTAVWQGGHRCRTLHSQTMHTLCIPWFAYPGLRPLCQHHCCTGCSLHTATPSERLSGGLAGLKYCACLNLCCSMFCTCDPTAPTPLPASLMTPRNPTSEETTWLPTASLITLACKGRRHNGTSAGLVPALK